MSILTNSLNEFKKLLVENDLLNEEIKVISARTLTPFQAVGKPERDDYPILIGREVLIEATFKGSKGQAFTDEPGNYQGELKNIIDMHLSNNFDRAVLIASINAVLKYLGLISATVHCKNEELGICAKNLAKHIKEKYGNPSIGLIGLQPGMANELSKTFKLRIVDLDKENFGKDFNGVKVEGPDQTESIITGSDIILATGSTAVNDTIDTFLVGKEVVFYGTTGAGVAYLNNLTTFCYFGS